jgi:DNA-binding NarL/FixJ family response regulator
LIEGTIESDVCGQIILERSQAVDEMNTTMPMPRILIADDQEEMVRIIAMTLANECDIIGTAKDGKRAIELVTQLLPDILVVDISMPIENGIEAAWHLKRLASPTRIIFVTIHTDPDFVEAARSAGALGYVWKESMASDLAPAVRAVLQGNRFTSPSIPLY